MRIVHGWIELPTQVKLQGPATAYIRIEDVSRADMAARQLGQQVLENISYSEFLRGGIAFQAPMIDVGEGVTCAVRVHLDLDGDGVVSPGDYVSVEHTSVPEDPTSPPVRIRLRCVD